MQVDSSFHLAFSMRMPNRDGAVALFRTDSNTTPVTTAFRGMTTPWNVVPTASLACTLAPTGVFPASTFCCRTTGNSRRGEEEGAVDFCWPRTTVPQSAITTAKTNKVRVDMVYVLKKAMGE